jgi:hypothetical protein
MDILTVDLNEAKIMNRYKIVLKKRKNKCSLKRLKIKSHIHCSRNFFLIESSPIMLYLNKII